MRRLDLRPGALPCRDPARRARLTRHLKARLEDFGPGGPVVRRFDQDAGIVSAHFPGHPAWELASRLAREYGVSVLPSGDEVLFAPGDQVAFEELDALWGVLWELLS